MLPRRRFVGAFASRLRCSTASSFQNETGTILVSETCNLLVASIWNRDRHLSGASPVAGRKRCFSSVGKEPNSQSQFVVPTVEVKTLLNEFDARKTAKPSELIALLKAGERERVIKFLRDNGTRLAVERVVPGPHWGPRELYDILIKLIIELEGKDAAMTVMRKMKQSSVTPTAFSFNSLLMQVERDEGIEHPLAVLDVMQSLEVRADSVTWSILLANCLKREDRDSMVKILEYVGPGSIQRWDERICNLLIQAYGTCYGFDRASEVLHIMMSEQVPPSVEVFKTLLRYANKDTSLEKVLRLLSIMEELQIEPDSFVQNQVARILAKHDQLRETLNILEELEKRGQKVGDTTYWVILNKCMKERNIEGLYYILDLMKASKRAPFRSFFNDLVNLFAEEGKVEEILKVLGTMEEMKVTTNVRTWTCVLKGYLKIGDMRNAFSVLSMMEKNNVKPDLQFFNTLLNALALKGLGKEAKVVLKALKQHGLKPDSRTLNALLGLYRKTEDRKGIEDVLVEVEQQEGVQLSKELLTSISSVFVDRRDMAGAMRVLKVMEANNIPLDNVALTSLLRLCAAQKDDKKAEELFLKAHHEGSTPDLVSFNWLLNVYHKVGNLQKALYTLDVLLEKKVKPNKFTCIPLIKTCQDCADYKTAFTIVEVLKNQGMVIDEEVCTHLFYLCEKAGATGLVENLEQVMKENGIASDKLQKMIVTWKGHKNTPTTQTQQTAKKKSY